MSAGARRDERSAPFFDAAREGVLLLRRCIGCGRMLVPESSACAACGGSELAWQAAAGDATLVSWAVIPPRTAGPESTGPPELPLVVGLIELTEGPWLQTRVVGSEAASLTVGLGLRCEFIAPVGGEPIPVFRPSDGLPG